MRYCSACHKKNQLKRPRQGGVTLLEVLIAMLILAGGLLGIAALQATSLQLNHSAQHRSTATMLASDIIETIRLNQNNTTPIMLQTWQNNIAQQLPAGTGAIASDGTFLTVTINWNDVAWNDGRAQRDPNTPQQAFVVNTDL